MVCEYQCTFAREEMEFGIKCCKKHELSFYYFNYIYCYTGTR